LRDEEILEHYRTIDKRSKVPVLVYNNPALTHINISVNLAIELSKMEKITGIKESSGDMTLTTEILRLAPPHFKVWLVEIL
jgi:4-hydroxy-tetrahydrodipicolinate synthase